MEEQDRNSSQRDPQRTHSGSEEKEISLVDLIRKLWEERRVIFKSLGIFIVIGLFVAFASPKEYTSSVKLVPEQPAQQGKAQKLLKQFGGVGGVDVGGLSEGMSSPFMNPYLYPEITKSLPFYLELIKKEVRIGTLDTTVTLYEYFQNVRTTSVLEYLEDYTIGLPGKIKAWIVSDEKGPEQLRADNNGFVRLTKKEKEVLEKLSNRVNTNLDEETGVVTIRVELPDPVAAAEVAQFSQDFLSEFIEKNRTKKVRQNLEFVKKRYNEAQRKFRKVQEALAKFRDQHKSLATAQARAEEKRLQNKYDLAFDLYKDLGRKLEKAKIKVQETTPVVSVLSSPKIPLEKSSPNRAMILLICAFSGIIISALFIVLKENWIF